MEAKRLASVQIWVSDLGKAAAFYRDFVGLRLDPPHRHEGNEAMHHDLVWGSFEDDTALMLHINQADDEHPPTSGAWLSFGVDDLDTVHRRASALGVTCIQPPSEGPWGRSARYADPDGNVIGLS